MNIRLATLVMILVISIYAFLGLFARPEIDDWCNMAAVMEHGIWNSTVQSYQTWTGRILYTATANFIASGQPLTGQLMPALLMAVCVAALTYAARPFTRAPFLVGLALTYALLQGPNIWQAFYIPSAALNYLPPLLAAAVLASMLYRRSSASWRAASPKDSPS